MPWGVATCVLLAGLTVSPLTSCTVHPHSPRPPAVTWFYG